MRCNFCGGPAHPATGCVYGPKTISCYRCTQDFWKWAKEHTGKRPRRSKQRDPQFEPKETFYEAAGKKFGRFGSVIRVRFPHSEKTALDPYSNKHVHLVKGAPRRMARSHKAQEIRRVRRMLARAAPGSRDQRNLRIYMAILLRKSGGRGSRYPVDEKTIRNWRVTPD